MMRANSREQVNKLNVLPLYFPHIQEYTFNQLLQNWSQSNECYYSIYSVITDLPLCHRKVSFQNRLISNPANFFLQINWFQWDVISETYIKSGNLVGGVPEILNLSSILAEISNDCYQRLQSVI